MLKNNVFRLPVDNVLARRMSTALMLGTALLPLSACGLSTASGPSTGAVSRLRQNPSANFPGIQIVDLNEAVVRRVVALHQVALFSESLGDGTPIGMRVGRGDVLDINIWESPPAALFGTVGGAGGVEARPSASSRPTSLAEQMVGSDGRITVPFAGSINAAGRTPHEIERDIVRRLSGKAHEPQVIVRLINNAAANVTIVGEVATSARMPLTAKGERLLDALASAGGVKQPVGKTTIQITRGQLVRSLPLDLVIRDPNQNIRLQADDVVTVLFQPFSFTALGATGVNSEIPFEGNGLTLAQALGRAGGIQDTRADAKGVFIFRLEDPSALGLPEGTPVKTTLDGKVPVIYRVDLRDPATFFLAQSFPIRNSDVLYVSNAPLADLQKFVNLLASLVFPLISVQNSLR